MAASLPAASLGSTDMMLTRVGFGAWAIGGGDGAYAWGNQDDTESIAAIRHAVESGINWIDTAAVYGLGHSEEVVAAALAGIPEADRPYVFTKGGLVWDPADRTLAPRRVGDPASLRAEVEASLRRLSVERIDLYQMHWAAEDSAAVAIAWTLAFPEVTGAIAGARRPRQVDGWLPAATLELTEDDLADIAAAVHATGAGTGPAVPAALAAPRVQ
jgi:aryl-alcohol dehydrogenase-like predicted oxidoreductase